MSKYLQCYEIYKEVILEITKDGVIMITMKTVWILNVKKVSNELSGPFAKVRALQADKDSRNPPEIFHKDIFLAKSFDWNTLYCFRKFCI